MYFTYSSATNCNHKLQTYNLFKLKKKKIKDFADLCGAGFKKNTIYCEMHHKIMSYGTAALFGNIFTLGGWQTPDEAQFVVSLWLHHINFGTVL